MILSYPVGLQIYIYLFMMTMMLTCSDVGRSFYTYSMQFECLIVSASIVLNSLQLIQALEMFFFVSFLDILVSVFVFVFVFQFLFPVYSAQRKRYGCIIYVFF